MILNEVLRRRSRTVWGKQRLEEVVFFSIAFEACKAHICPDVTRSP
jgi:hypothetical protein